MLSKRCHGALLAALVVLLTRVSLVFPTVVDPAGHGTHAPDIALGLESYSVPYTLRVHHVNDIHVHLDQINSKGFDCNETKEHCYGGTPRMQKWLLENRPKDKPSILLSAGDETTGTLFYRAHGHAKTAAAMNQMNFTAMCLGNHEFDSGLPVLHDFMDMLEFPVLSANVELPPYVRPASPDRKTTYKRNLERYEIFPDMDLAIIGATTETTGFESKAGHDAKFTNVVKAVQDAVDEIRSTTKINRIILLSHIGYDIDIKMAEQTTGLYYIVGGHTDTLLGKMPRAEGKYPTIVKNKDGEKVYIVQNFHWGYYLGVNDVTFAPDGKVTNVEGKLILLRDDLQKAPLAQARIDRWRTHFDYWGPQIVGENYVANSFRDPDCKDFPCFAGHFSADAMYAHYHRENPEGQYAFSMVNGGGCRSAVPVGKITNAQLFHAFPFENTIRHLNFTGQFIWDTFSKVLSGLNETTRDNGTLFHTSYNVAVKWNYAELDRAKRLTSVKVDGKDLDVNRIYTVVVTDFLAYGGDDYWSRNETVGQDWGSVEDSLRLYLKEGGPIWEYRAADRMLETSGTRKLPYYVAALDNAAQSNYEPQEDPRPWSPNSSAGSPLAKGTVALAALLVIALLEL